jgi:hypothetical protein
MGHSSQFIRHRSFNSRRNMQTFDREECLLKALLLFRRTLQTKFVKIRLTTQLIKLNHWFLNNWVIESAKGEAE